jgi:16S rRNA (guanine966-N2)-methyltransferase
VRIVAGSAKGIRLAPVPDGTRPLADRAREGLFSSLGDAVRDARVLDLFAGTGAVAIEALSRGAASAVLVDTAPRAVRTARANLERTRLEDRATVVRMDAAKAVQSDMGEFELVFLDPPYATPDDDVSALLGEIAARDLVSGGGLVVVTRPIKSSIPVIPVDWSSDRRLSYGDAVVLVYMT